MSVSDAQYAAFVDRVVACREAEDRTKADTKALYAEIAEAGEDKTAIGLFVRELRLSNKDRVKAEIRDAAVEEGRVRYRRGKASHVRAREERTEGINLNANVSGALSVKTDAEEIDPETGEIIEDNTAAADQSTGNVGGSAGRLHSMVVPPAESTASVPVDTHSETHDGGAGESPAGGITPTAEEAVPPASSVVTPFVTKPLRPYCLNREVCAGQGRKHCYSCEKAHSQALPITTGGTSIQHMGRVGE